MVGLAGEQCSETLNRPVGLTVNTAMSHQHDAQHTITDSMVQHDAQHTITDSMVKAAKHRT